MRIAEKWDIRIVVEPAPPPWGYGVGDEPHMVSDAEEIAAQIRRHVDNVGNVKVEWTTLYRCVFCGYQNATGEYEDCCNQAQAEHDRVPETPEMTAYLVAQEMEAEGR